MKYFREILSIDEDNTKLRSQYHYYIIVNFKVKSCSTKRIFHGLTIQQVTMEYFVHPALIQFGNNKKSLLLSYPDIWRNIGSPWPGIVKFIIILYSWEIAVSVSSHTPRHDQPRDQ